MIYDVCNVFKSIENNNGNFLLFSQYTNDLAKSSVDPGYNVRPSRFLCLNLNKTSLNNISQESDNNVIIPKYLQNFYENGLSYMRTFYNKSYTPLLSSIDFYVRLLQIVLGKSWVLDSAGGILSNYIVYDNEIDLESWSDGFADIIINIPSGASKKTYNLNNVNDSSIEALGNTLGKWEWPDVNDNYILGRSINEHLPIPGTLTGNNISTYIGNKAVDFNHQNSFFDYLISSNTSSTEEDSFTFNTILICYDIIDEHNNPIYKDLPMGIYITGTWDSANNSFLNSITIYKSVDSALNVGSSWSLRISTKFAPTPIGQLKVEDTAVESGAITNSLSAIMSANAELIRTINNMSKKMWVDTQSYRDLLAIFKDGRTNIPYIKNINGTNYWFVNGKNTEVPVYQ